jgi:hypothetical protein
MMKARTFLSLTALAVLTLHSGRGLAQLHDEEAMKAWGEGVNKQVIAGLVTNRTWHINWATCMGGSDGCRTYWDFADDGTMCARGIDATRKDKCADEGNWRIEDNALCWELSWLGGGEGYKSTCILIKDNEAGTFETTRTKGLGLPFFQFKLAKDN